MQKQQIKEIVRMCYGFNGKERTSIGLADTSFEIHLTTSKRAEINGLEEEECKQVEDYIAAHYDFFKNVYLANFSMKRMAEEREEKQLPSY